MKRATVEWFFDRLGRPPREQWDGQMIAGFTAGTGGATNRHLIDSLEVTGEVCD